MTEQIPQASGRRIAIAVVGAAIVAGVLLVTAILPAEYGVDPLGIGRALGLTALSGTVTGPAPSASPSPVASAEAANVAVLSQDVYKVELRPFEGVEYKYRLGRGASLVYSWEASSPVEFEFHGEPDGAPKNYFDSYAKGKAASTGHGAFTADKAGVHGWFWKNHGEGRVTVTLTSAGFFTASTEYRDGERIPRTFPR